MLGELQTPEYRIAEDARLATDLPIDLARETGMSRTYLSRLERQAH
jgi:hypothetical protein